jgi:DNA polymerase I-like protein with 3'-5' exonuclease and polymerase domains
VLSPGGRFAERRIEEVLCSDSTLVSYHLEDLFCYLKRKPAVRAKLVDICQIVRLTTGTRVRDRTRAAPWHIARVLLAVSDSRATVASLLRVMYSRDGAHPESQVLTAMSTLAALLSKAWREVLVRAESAGETRRFWEVEQPVNQLFLSRQLAGVRVSQRQLLKRLDMVDEEVSRSARLLRDDWGVSDPRDPDALRHALENVGLPATRAVTKHDIDETRLDLYAEHNSLAALVKSYRDNIADKRRLLRLGAIGVRRVYPVYNTLGTVSGRIMVSLPGLQFIKKANRDIVIADPGKALLYPDFAQFEPGVMADDSRDKTLQRDFNQGDVYAALSRRLFRSAEARNTAKILFLAFCYGMQPNALAKLVSIATHMPGTSARAAIDGFFGRYKTLSTWRMSLGSELRRTGRIGTRLGNFRYRTRTGALSADEKRWVLSQRIQGTASLILKRIILGVAKRLPEVDILLPMHDALLVQAPEGDLEDTREGLRRVFVSECRKECPSVRPRVVFEDFFRPVHLTCPPGRPAHNPAMECEPRPDSTMGQRRGVTTQVPRIGSRA